MPLKNTHDLTQFLFKKFIASYTYVTKYYATYYVHTRVVKKPEFLWPGLTLIFNFFRVFWPKKTRNFKVRPDLTLTRPSGSGFFSVIDPKTRPKGTFVNPILHWSRDRKSRKYVLPRRSLWTLFNMYYVAKPVWYGIIFKIFLRIYFYFVLFFVLSAFNSTFKIHILSQL